MSALDQLTVIVPTLAMEARCETLQRALASIRAQDVPCRPLVVVNGDRRSARVVAALAAEPGVTIVERAEPDLVAALAAGVAAVETPFFCFLDDDDTLYPDAARRRLRWMARAPDTDVLVTPGERRHADGTVTPCPDLARVDPDDLLGSLLTVNWLASCGGVFRRATVGPEAFAAMPRYLEWTYLAFQLALDARVRLAPTDEAPHFTVFETAASESASPAYTFAMPGNLERLRTPALPARLRAPLSRKLADAYHAAADQALNLERRRVAWGYHLKSLRQRSGWQYLSFTRHLLWPRPLLRNAAR
jgi:hypothetical protein